MTDPLAMKPTDAFAELGRIRFSDTDFATALATVADLGKRTIPCADEVSITLVGPGGAHTAAFTGERAVIVDKWQYQQGHGPCLAAAAANITVTVPDMAGESRWPDWADRAIDAGVHSAMSIGLPLRESVSGAVNVYAAKPHAFDQDAVILAETFAGYAAVAMANAHRYDGTATLAEHAHAAMDRRAVIEQAKGIIMAERRCTADEAFAILVKVSEYSGRELGDVGAVLVASAVQAPKRRARCTPWEGGSVSPATWMPAPAPPRSRTPRPMAQLTPTAQVRGVHGIARLVLAITPLAEILTLT